MTIARIHDLTDPSDPQGRSYKQVNQSKSHSIPLGTLVELESGCRMFVVFHGRDCDETPLYYLGLAPQGKVVSSGWSEASLRQLTLVPPSMIEVIDISDGERYFPQGYFSSLDSANEAIDKCCAKDGCPPSSEITEPEFGVVLEMRQLDVGWHDPVLVCRRTWQAIYDEPNDKYLWKELEREDFPKSRV